MPNTTTPTLDIAPRDVADAHGIGNEAQRVLPPGVVHETAAERLEWGDEFSRINAAIVDTALSNTGEAKA